MTSAPITALNEILDAADLSPAASRVSLIGDDPVWPTRYRIGAAGAAAIAATGVAAAQLWKLRTGAHRKCRSACAPQRPRCAVRDT